MYAEGLRRYVHIGTIIGFTELIARVGTVYTLNTYSRDVYNKSRYD